MWLSPMQIYLFIITQASVIGRNISHVNKTHQTWNIYPQNRISGGLADMYW